MKAVNLIPSDQRGGRIAGRAGAGVYILLGGLAVLVLMVAALALTTKSVHDKRGDLASVQTRAASAEAQAAALAPYTRFTALRATRTQTVQSIAASRFDWSHALREVSRTIPKDTKLSGLRATVSPDTPVDGGASVSLRSALAVPAMELTGCTTNQTSVARMLSAMRQVDGVQRVSLQQSVRPGAGSSSDGASGSSSTAGCPSNAAQFQIVVFFNPQTAPAASTGAAPAQSASATTSTTTGGTP